MAVKTHEQGSGYAGRAPGKQSRRCWRGCFFLVVVEDRMRGGVGYGSVFLADRRYKYSSR